MYHARRERVERSSGKSNFTGLRQCQLVFILTRDSAIFRISVGLIATSLSESDGDFLFYSCVTFLLQEAMEKKFNFRLFFGVDNFSPHPKKFPLPFCPFPNSERNSAGVTHMSSSSAGISTVNPLPASTANRTIQIKPSQQNHQTKYSLDEDCSGHWELASVGEGNVVRVCERDRPDR